MNCPQKRTITTGSSHLPLQMYIMSMSVVRPACLSFAPPTCGLCSQAKFPLLPHNHFPEALFKTRMPISFSGKVYQTDKHTKMINTIHCTCLVYSDPFLSFFFFILFSAWKKSSIPQKWYVMLELLWFQYAKQGFLEKPTGDVHTLLIFEEAVNERQALASVNRGHRSACFGCSGDYSLLQPDRVTVGTCTPIKLEVKRSISTEHRVSL